MSLPHLRRLFLDIHLWIGAGLAILLIPLGLTGSALVYRPELEHLLSAGTYQLADGPRLAPSAYVAAATRAQPDLRPSQIRYPQFDGDPITVSAMGAPAEGAGGRPAFRNILLDPATAAVIGVINPQGGLFGTVHRFHESLMVRGIGRQLVGWLGLAMTVSCLTGIYLWWPRNNAFFKGLRWRRGPSLYSNLHHMAGFWILIPLTALCITGVYISFPQTARTMTQMIAPMSAQNARGPRGRPIDQPTTTIDHAANAAIGLVPDATLDSIALPVEARGKDPVWRVSLRKAHEDAPLIVEIDDKTGKARVQSQSARKPGDVIAALMRGLHEGEGLGPIWKALVFITGLAPALLSITGIVIWLGRRARRASAARPATN